MTTSDRVRLTLDLTKEQDNRLIQLTRLIGKPSKANIVREALEIYEYIANSIKNGASIQIEKDGKMEKLVILGLIHVNTNDNLTDY